MCKNIVVNYTGRKGGGALYAFEMAKSLVENGCNVYAILSKDIDNLHEWRKIGFKDLYLIPTYNTKLDYIINTVKFKLFGVRKLKKQFRFVNIDVVYVPMIQPWTRMINSLFKNSKSIVTIHDPKPHTGSNVFFNNLCKKVAIEADNIVVLSEIFKDYCIEKFKKKKDNIHVIPHGIFNYYKKVENKDIVINYDKDKINFLFFGRITKYKGLHILAEAYKMISREFQNVSLTIVGNGDFSEYWDAYKNLLNIKIINRWINDEEVGSFFRGNNVVTVLPYTDATQSGVIPVAMEYKSLVIASNTGGLSEQVTDNETGYLFEANNVYELYKTMKYVIKHYDEQCKILDNAFNYINSLSWDVLGKKLISIFN